MTTENEFRQKSNKIQVVVSFNVVSPSCRSTTEPDEHSSWPSRRSFGAIFHQAGVLCTRISEFATKKAGNLCQRCSFFGTINPHQAVDKDQAGVFCWTLSDRLSQLIGPLVFGIHRKAARRLFMVHMLSHAKLKARNAGKRSSQKSVAQQTTPSRRICKAGCKTGNRKQMI